MNALALANKAFHSEAHELLAQMEDALLQLETHPADNELIESVFRAARTIRTTGAVFGYFEIETLTKLTEQILDTIRGAVFQIEPHPIALLMACRDHISVLVDNAVIGVPLNYGQNIRHTALIEQLNQHLGTGSEEHPHPFTLTVPTHNNESSKRYDSLWHVFVEFGPDVLRNGMDPITFLQYLEKIGRLDSVKTNFDSMPSALLMDPMSCYVSCEISFQSDTATKLSVEKIFDLVRADVMISILPPSDRMGDMIGAIEQLPEDVGVLGDVLARTGTITQSELNRALAEQKRHRDAGQNAATIPRLGQLLIQQKAVRPEIIEAAVEKQNKANKFESKSKAKAQIQLATGQWPVDARQLDQLINLVAELAAIGASTKQLAERYAEDRQIVDSMASIFELAEEIRRQAARLRSR